MRHHRAMRHHAAHPMPHAAGRHAGGRMGMRGAPRDAGSSAVDQLNEQSLAKARGGQ
jgi:hypothetical protein